MGILGIIYSTPENCIQKLISEQTYLPKQTVNTIIKSFLDRGFVELKDIAADRRNKRIWLNEAGKEYADNIIGKLCEAEKEAMEHLTSEQRIVLIELIGIYEEQFKASVRADG